MHPHAGIGTTEVHPMLELITTLYDWDTFRFALWYVLESSGLDTHAIQILQDLGFTVWEDFSVSREAAS